MSGLMSIGKSAMFASYSALQTTGNNIANANTPGYSREQTQLASAAAQFTGAGFFGKGVDVVTVTRAYDQYLTNQAVGSASTASADSARLAKLTQLEGVFPLGEAGLGSTAGQFLNSFVDLANNPSDSSARQVVLSQAQGVTSAFRAAGDQLNEMQAGVTQDVKVAVASVNGLAKQVASLNKQIATLKGSGQTPNQLLDQRDQLVSQIAAQINVTSIQADDGSVGLFIGGGQNLVLGGNSNTLLAVSDTFDPAKVGLAIRQGNSNSLVPPDSLGGGVIAGALKFQNEDLTAANNLLGQMAAALGGSVNLQQSLGLDLGVPAGAGAPIFAVGGPRLLAASGNAGSAAIGVSTFDASKLQASDYELSFDGSNYAMTRLSDGSVASGSPYTPAQMATGVQVDGITLQLSAGTASAGDRFLLQPVAMAASQMKTVLGNANGIAAAAPFTGGVGAGNTGTASVASLVAVNPAYNAVLSASIAFTSGTGNYAWSLSNGTSGTGVWTAGTPISLNGFELSLSGVPKSGDTVTVAPTAAAASNNGNALAFAALGHSSMVAQLGGLGAESITNAYASALANIGVRVQGGKIASTASSEIAARSEAARADKAGVNLDEEAARLIQFQQSYQAAAKILQIAQSVFQSMLQTTAG